MRNTLVASKYFAFATSEAATRVKSVSKGVLKSKIQQAATQKEGIRLAYGRARQTKSKAAGPGASWPTRSFANARALRFGASSARGPASRNAARTGSKRRRELPRRQQSYSDWQAVLRDACNKRLDHLHHQGPTLLLQKCRQLSIEIVSLAAQVRAQIVEIACRCGALRSDRSEDASHRNDARRVRSQRGLKRDQRRSPSTAALSR
eukprot:6183768-Pleurochrysis_carterae.AAC.1